MLKNMVGSLFQRFRKSGDDYGIFITKCEDETEKASISSRAALSVIANEYTMHAPIPAN